MHLAAGVLSFVARNYHDSVAQLHRAVELAPDNERAWFLLRERCARLGWDKEVVAVERARLKRDPDNVAWHVWALRTQLGRRNWRRAAEHGRVAAEAMAEHAGLQLEVANVLATIGAADEARRAVNRALAAEPTSYPHRLEASRVLRRVGALEAAMQHARRAIEIDEHAVEPKLLLAEMHLWQGRHDLARALANTVLQLDPENGPATRVLGAICYEEGDEAGALELFDRAVERAPEDSESRAWRAELGLRSNRETGAISKDLTRCTMSADGFPFAAWIVRLLLSLRGDPSRSIARDRFQEIERGLVALFGDEALPVLEKGDVAAVVDLLNRALKRMHGNRSTLPTELANGTVRTLGDVSGVRFDCRRALELIRVEEPESVLAELDEIFERYGQHALAMCHRGEVSVWLGDWATARRDLERTLEIHWKTRWAYIGLSMVEIAAGNYERALEVSADGVKKMDNTYGPAVYSHDADALRLLGRHEEALSNYDRSLELSPKRISSRIGRALSLAALGHDERFDAELGDLAETAPVLLSDAARELGTTLWGDSNEIVATRLEAVAILEHCLEMFRGNRSSTCQLYFTNEGKLRAVEHFGPHTRSLHALDDEDIQIATNILLRAIAPGRPKAPREDRVRKQRVERVEPRPDPVLDDEQIEHFIDHGFVMVRGCFDRDTAEAWTREAIERIRSEPEKCVRRYDPDDPARSLRDFDPEDPDTWTWPRIDLMGNRNVRVSELAPRAWAAMCDLLGGPQRIKTKTWANYMVVNVCDRVAEWTPPAWDVARWHIDDPTAFGGLDTIRNGLVVIALFSDWEHKGGGTFVAPRTHAAVARRMAETPGLDLNDEQLMAEVMGETRETHEVTGKAGDVVFMHPLLLHTGSFNHSNRIRWLSNPTIYTSETLKLERRDGDYSPVERAIRRALGSDDAR